MKALQVPDVRCLLCGACHVNMQLPLTEHNLPVRHCRVKKDGSLEGCELRASSLRIAVHVRFAYHCLVCLLGYGSHWSIRIQVTA